MPLDTLLQNLNLLTSLYVFLVWRRCAVDCSGVAVAKCGTLGTKLSSPDPTVRKKQERPV